MAARNMKKVAVSVLALGAATSAIVFGSFASWTASTTNTPNTVTAATFNLTNDHAGSVFTVNATDLKPGDNPTAETVTLTNASSIPMNMKLSKTAGTDNITDAGNTLKVQIGNATECFLPANASPCGTSYATWTNTLSNVAVASAVPAGATRAFQVRYKFEDNSAVTGPTTAKSSTFDLTWSGTPS